jgi:polyhydroxyalkanoate synthase
MARDHIAPWRSVYKIRLFADTDVTFALASGGHNVGIVNPPAQKRGSYQVMTMGRNDRYIEPNAWVAEAPHFEGSWWPAWEAWVRATGSSGQVEPPRLGATEKGLPPLCDAPGVYVRR